MIRLIDTDILIDHLRGRADAAQFLKSCLASGDRLLCSVISHSEILAGMRPAEERETRALLACLAAVAVDEAVAEAAATYRRAFGKSHGALLPDALIAGTAKVWSVLRLGQEADCHWMRRRASLNTSAAGMA